MAEASRSQPNTASGSANSPRIEAILRTPEALNIISMVGDMNALQLLRGIDGQLQRSEPNGALVHTIATTRMGLVGIIDMLEKHDLGNAKMSELASSHERFYANSIAMLQRAVTRCGARI